MKTERPTQSVVAREAGVSQMTVSLALRNHPSIPKKTRDRVRAIAERLGYRPNPLISALMRQVRERRRGPSRIPLAYLTAFPTVDGWKERPIFRRSFEGAAEHAALRGYKLEPFWVTEPGMTGRWLSQVLQTRGIRGLIVAPLPRPRGHLRMDWGSFAAAAVGYSLWQPALHRAVHHQTHSMQLALRQLKRLGYRRVGLALSARFDARANNHWSGAYLANQRNLPPAHRLEPLVADDWNYKTFAAWLKQQRPDVVIGGSLEALQWLRALKKRVPEECGYVCMEISEEMPGIAGIHQNAHHVGAAAADLVIEQLEQGESGIPTLPKVVLIEGRWVMGRTVKRQRR